MNALHRTAFRFATVLALGLASLGAQAFEMRGFRGVSWGEGVESLGASQLVQTDGNVSCYRREAENLIFGDSPLQEVRYCFHRDQFFMVSLGAALSSKALAAEFRRAYGAPSSRQAKAAVWGNKSGSARAEVVATSQGGSSLALYSNQYDPSGTQAMDTVQHTASLAP